MKNIFFIIVFICLVFLCSSEKVTDEEQIKPAYLMASKKILNKYLVEDQEIHIEYNIFNVGRDSALNVKIVDINISPQYFDFINKTSSILIPKILPNGKESKKLIFKSRSGATGAYNFTSADIFYQSANSNIVKHGFTSEPGIGYILSKEEYEKRFSLHLLDWGLFVLLTFPSLLIPFLLYYKSKRKYERILTLNNEDFKN